MIAPLMIYAVAIGLSLAAVGVMLERVAALIGRPRRWVWAGALVATLLFAGALPWRAAAPTVPASIVQLVPVTLGRAGVAATTSLPLSRPSRWAVASGRLRTGADRAAAAVARLDAFGRWLWIVASVALALIYGLGQWTLSRRRRHWRVDRVHGVRVLVAPQDGPAVIGVLRPAIVLPEWALMLEPHAIDLMLRHEREHDAACDPLLMHLAGLALLVMPWNPAGWWMVSRLRLAVELDCDARVLGAAHLDGGARPSDVSVYGELLIAVAARRSPRRALVATAMLEPASSLRRRISAMYPRNLRLRGLRLAAASGAALVLVAVALLLPVPRLLGQTSMPVIETVTAVSPPAPMPAEPTLKSVVPTTPRKVPAASAMSSGAQATGRGDIERNDIRAWMETLDRQTTAHYEPVYDIGNGIVAPIVIKRVDPTYPPAALATKIEGEVHLEGVIETNGKFSGLTVKRSLEPTLDQAALDAAAQWLFRPGLKDGKPVRVHVELLLDFRLTPTPGVYPAGTARLVQPIVKFQPDPTYTSDAMRAKIQGTVMVAAVVELDGTVGSAHIVQSLDETYGLDDAALEAAKRWTFEPGTLDGKPVRVSVTLTLEFRLH